MSRVMPGIALSIALVATACSGGAPSTSDSTAGCIKIIVEKTGEKTDKCLPLAPEKQRVDTTTPTFPDPTSITNPLHPTSLIDQTIYGGQVEGLPFRTEVTLLPETKRITIDGQPLDAVAVQYLAYLDGRIEEVAIDWFAQADDGSVWYLGEDVFNYADGEVADTDGTWLAGKTGPPAMIMPADPRVGDVYRPENAPEIVFEEVTVKAIGQTVDGPYGQIDGAIVVNELHMDGSREDKVFAPGYGEFSTGNPAGDLEAASLAMPTDARPGPIPAELTALSAAVRQVFDALAGNDWAAASTATRTLGTAWDAYRARDLPAGLDRQMSRDVEALTAAIAAASPDDARLAILRVAQNELDLQLPFRTVVGTDLARFELWSRQLQVDATAGDSGSVAGDVTTLEWIRDRVTHAVDPTAAAAVDTQLQQLRTAADAKDLAAVLAAAPALLATVTPLLTTR